MAVGNSSPALALAVRTSAADYHEAPTVTNQCQARCE